MALKFTYARVWSEIASSLGLCYDWVGLLKAGKRDLLPVCSSHTVQMHSTQLSWCDLLGSYEAFTGWKCFFLLFQLLLTNPFLFIIFSVKKERSSLNCFVIENEIIRKKKEKKRNAACSLFFCKVPLLSFDLSIILTHRRFWGGSNEPDPQLEEQNLLHRAGGDLPFMALSLGELWEGIQASRKLVGHRFILLCHSRSHTMVNKRKIVLSACGITAVLFAVRWQQILSLWHRALAQGELGWLSAQPFPFLLADLGRALHCKGSLYWVLQCRGGIPDNAPVSHPSLPPPLCSCREELIGFSC